MHFHMLVPDGVFVADGTGAEDRPRFVEQEAPSDEEVAELLSDRRSESRRSASARSS